MKDINDIMPKIPNMKWGALMNKPPTNDKVEEMNKIFPSNGKWLMGVFMNFNEEGSSYYCHVILDEEPNRPFLKYSTNNGIEPSFVDNPSEHGYSYIKIIKLKDTHPLVDHGQLQN